MALVCLYQKILKVACRVQIWKKTFCQNNDYFRYPFIKNDIMFMHLLCIYKKSMTLKMFKIDTLNFTMYVLTILTCPLKTYVVRLHNLTSMNIFFTIDHEKSQVFFVLVKRKPKPVSMNINKQPSEVFCKKKCSQKFRKITGKRLYQSLFFIKLQAEKRGFPVNFAKFLSHFFLQNTSGRLLLQKE